MRRGELSNLRAPETHVSWGMVFVPPSYHPKGGWRARLRLHLFDLAVRLRWKWAAARFLQVRRHIGKWLFRHAGKTEFVVIVIGPAWMADVARRVIEKEQLWVKEVRWQADWYEYASHARLDPPLELIIGRDEVLPVVQGIAVRRHAGWGHVPANQ